MRGTKYREPADRDNRGQAIRIAGNQGKRNENRASISGTKTQNSRYELVFFDYVL